MNAIEEFMKKKIVIIGGTKGIGRELVDRLIEQEHELYLFSRTEDGLPKSSLIKHQKFDVSKDEFKEELLPDIVDAYVYCPGSINLKPFERMKPEQFEEEFQINLMGNVKVLQKILPKLKKSEDASAVFFSTVAVQRGMNFHASVASAKGALEGLMRSLAAEFAPKIRFNCIAPSLTESNLSKKLFSNEQVVKSSTEKHPLKRLGKPKDIASLAAYLLSNESSWITGQVLGVDGGISTLSLA